MTEIIDARKYLPGTARTVIAVVQERDGSTSAVEAIHDDDWRYDHGSCELIMREVTAWWEKPE